MVRDTRNAVMKNIRTWMVVSLVLLLAAACSAEPTPPLGFLEPDPTSGIPCADFIPPEISDATLAGDLVKGWGFILKQPIGFAEHGCLVVSANDGYPTRSGDHAIRFEVRDGDCNRWMDGWNDCTTDRSRHELTQIGISSPSQQDGDEYWYAWSEYLPTATLKEGKAITFLGQFNSDNAARFYIEDFHDGVGFRFNDRNYDLIKRKTLAQNQIVRNGWTDFMIHAVWSTSDDGLIEIYVNGGLAETVSGPNMDGASKVHFDFGIYNAFLSRCSCDSMPTQIVYFDDIRRGLTRHEVEVAPRL